MKMFLLSDNIDSLTAFRLAGIEGEVIHTKEELKVVLERILNDEDIITCLMTTKVFELDEERFLNLKLNVQRPLFVEISDRHKSHEVSEMLDETIAKIVGRVN